MTETEQKALALLMEVRKERSVPPITNEPINRSYIAHEALCRAIEQTEAQAAEIERLIHDLERQMTIANEHVDEAEAFNQEVRDMIKDACKFAKKDPHHLTEYLAIRFYSLIAPETKPKPDPLVEVIAGWTGGTVLLASDLRAALDAAGFEIREKRQ